MLNFDRLDARVIARLDATDLEICRLRMLRESDERFDLVVERLVLLGLPTLTRVAREEGERAGLSEESIRLGIEDAAAKFLMRLTRRAKLPAVTAVAATIAAEAVALQAPRPKPVMVRRRPALRIVPNDWKNS